MTNWPLIKKALQQLQDAIEKPEITDRQIENGVTKIMGALISAGHGFRSYREFQPWSVDHTPTGDRVVYGPLTRAEARAWLDETAAHVARLPEANK